MSRFSRDGSTGVTWLPSIEDGSVLLFDPSTGEPFGAPHVSDVGVIEVVLAGDGSVVAISRADGSISFLNGDGVPIAPPVDLGGPISHLSLDGDGETLAAIVSPGGGPAESVVIDVATSQVTATYVLDAEFEPIRLVVAPDGSFFVQIYYEVPGSSEPSGFDIVMVDGTLMRRVETPGRFAQAFAVSSDLIAMSFFDGTISVFDIEGVAPPVDLLGHTASITNVSLTEDRVVTASGDDTVRLWTLEGKPVGAPLAAIDVISLAVDESGSVLISLRGGGHVVAEEGAAVVVEEIRPARNMQVMSDTDRFFEQSPLSDELLVRNLSDGEVVASLDAEPRAEPPSYSIDGEWILVTQVVEGRMKPSHLTALTKAIRANEAALRSYAGE